MDTSTQAPTSDDGLYGLAEVEPASVSTARAYSVSPAELAAPQRAPATLPPKPEKPVKARKKAKAKTEGGGMFGRLFGKDASKGKPDAKPEAAAVLLKTDPTETPVESTAAEAPTAAYPAIPAEAEFPKPKSEAEAAASVPAAPKKPAAPSAPKLRIKKKRKGAWKYEAPAWIVSGLVHVGLLGALGVIALTAEVPKKPNSFDAAPFDPKIAGEQANEMVHIYADPTAAPRDQAVGDNTAAATPGATTLGTGTGPPSANPKISGSASTIGEGSLPQVKVVTQLSGLSLLPASSPSKDFSMRSGGGGNSGFSGDVTMGTKDVGEALDQLAREILRHLTAHKLTVIWLFDESESMKDDQRAVKGKFDRVTSELNLNMGDDKKSANALNHVIFGFGDSLHPEIAKPTNDINVIGKAIDRLAVDPSGTERTCEAIARVVNDQAKLMKDGRRLLLVLVTDESGDDGQNVEEARQALVTNGVPLYVIGRQSLFGYDRAQLQYVDPVTKEVYWPTIKRGPESAERETLQVDGLHERWDEQPSGFAPYELARLAKESGGIYFLLPSEENMRVKQREKAYSITTLKEYVPSYEPRAAYIARREKSELGRVLHGIIQETSKDYIHRRAYSIDIEQCQKEILEEVPKAQFRLKRYAFMENQLKAAKPLRDREPDKRWQAHYDLMLAQIVACEIKTYEYLTCLDEMADLMRKGQLKPKKMPIPEQLSVNWAINHSHTRKAPKAETEKKYAEVKVLLETVIKNHPKTPWADLAQDVFDRGFGCQRDEEHHSPGYAERAKMVPKY